MSTLAGLIVGLGNPGLQYDRTRHNLGFMLVEALLADAERAGRRVDSLSGDKFRCRLWRVMLPDNELWLVSMPQTFMNLSGESVQPLAAWHRIPPDQILVAHDELDLPPGRMRCKIGGGNAGHNGLTSITQRLGTPDFYRLRLGIGRPPLSPDKAGNPAPASSAQGTTGWVLGHFNDVERAIHATLLPAAVSVVHTFAREGGTAATRLANAFKLPEPANTKTG